LGTVFGLLMTKNSATLTRIYPVMTNLSPAAQAIEEAVDNAWSNSRARAAAALRAAADQVVPEQAEPVGDSHDEARHDQWMRIRYKLLAIADELDGHAHTELDRLIALIPTEGAIAMAELIRRALEALPND
jgi:hypothetical protein